MLSITEKGRPVVDSIKLQRLRQLVTEIMATGNSDMVVAVKKVGGWGWGGAMGASREEGRGRLDNRAGQAAAGREAQGGGWLPLLLPGPPAAGLAAGGQELVPDVVTVGTALSACGIPWLSTEPERWFTTHIAHLSEVK